MLFYVIKKDVKRFKWMRCEASQLVFYNLLNSFCPAPVPLYLLPLVLNLYLTVNSSSRVSNLES